MNIKRAIDVLRLTCLLLFSANGFAYPLDAYEETGIGRLEPARRIDAGEMEGRKQPWGATLPSAEVDIRLTAQADMALPEVDEAFSNEIRALLGDNLDRYSISVLDLSDLDKVRYAEHRGDILQNPGSVGKLLVALAIFQQLADLYPDDIEKRKQVLRETRITADDFIISDHHTVMQWDRQAEKVIRRPLQIGDVGSLWEYLDWMVSPSSNAAGATLMKQAVLMKHFGHDYPVSDEEANRFLRETPKGKLQALLASAMHDPITRNGLDINRIRQGSLFTYTGKRHIPGTTSYSSSRALLKFLLLMEQGRLVDNFSSREIKRLMYVTERRIRYASAPQLHESAVYFKSGSLYECKKEPDFVCGKYMGNVKNYMNSAAIIESPARNRKLFYIVTLLSDVLRKNSAVDHQTLAIRIQQLLQKHHGIGTKPGP